MLRMDRSMSDEDRLDHVRSTMQTLALDRSAKTVIARLSGGEKKTACVCCCASHESTCHTN